MAYNNGVLIVRDTRTHGPDPAAGMCNGKRGVAIQQVVFGKHHPKAETRRRALKSEFRGMPRLRWDSVGDAPKKHRVGRMDGR